jgi:hypothetical protein
MTADRLKNELETLFSLLLPRLAYFVEWEARVIVATPPTPSASPPVPPAPGIFIVPAKVSVVFVDSEAIKVFGLQLANVALWADSGGNVAVPTPGSLVRVAFANGSPTKPYIAGIDPQVMPTVSLTQALRLFAGTPPLTPGTVTANAVALLAALGFVG